MAYYMVTTDHAIGPAISELVDPEPVAECVIAFRAWRLRGGQLAPMMKADGGEDWSPLGPVNAVCRCQRDKETKELAHPEKHQCGFYGFRTLKAALHEYRGAGAALFGVVALSRRVYVFDNGFRAERATPLALLDSPPSPPLNTPWRELGLPILGTQEELFEYAAQFGHMDDQVGGDVDA